MQSILSTAILTVMCLSLIGCNTAPVHNHYAALAIDSHQGNLYGFAHDYSTEQEAEARALAECGKNCKVVKKFSSGCGAYAADQAKGSQVYGWSHAPSEQEAKKQALEQCHQYGGSQCLVRVWSCNSQ